MIHSFASSSLYTQSSITGWIKLVCSTEAKELSGKSSYVCWWRYNSKVIGAPYLKLDPIVLPLHLAEEVTLAMVHQEELEKDEYYEQWVDENNLQDIIDVDKIPAFNASFSQLVKKKIKINDGFMTILRTEGQP
jgi:hypothetical protein